jgi:heavy metal sensor kinase
MRRRSLRLNLILWFSSIFAVILALSDYVTYRVLRGVLVSELDTYLLSIASQHGSTLRDDQSGPESEEERHFGPHFVQIVDSSGKVLAQFGLNESIGRAISDAQLATVLSGGVVVGEASTHPSVSRVAAVRGQQAGQPVAVVAGTASNAVSTITSQIAILLLIIDVLAVGASIVGGSLIIGKALRPVDHITDRARQIGEGDIRRRLEFVDSSAEMVHLTSVLNEMLDKLQRMFESQRQFVQDAAHEIRSPLAALRCRLEVALRQRRPAENYQEVIEGALEDSTRLTGLAEDLFLLARADSDNLAIEFREVLLSEVVLAVHAQLVPLAESRQVEFEVNVESDCLVYGDRERLHQAVRNLAENALKYTPAGGRVIMRVQSERDDARVIVEDTGIGIPVLEQQKVFRRFYRVDRARSRSDGGTGLGLAICDQIIRAHRGSIDLWSEPGRGSRFTVHLASASSLVEAAPAGAGEDGAGLD